MGVIDIKNISVYDFLEIVNSKGIIKQYFESIPNIEEEHFSVEEEKEISNSKEFNILQNTIYEKFLGK